MKSRESATIVFKNVLGAAHDRLDPGARNSNLLPVKANGLVRFRSVASSGSGGRVFTPTRRVPGFLLPFEGAFFRYLV